MRECDDTCEFCNHARVPDDLDWYTYFMGGWDYECSLEEEECSTESEACSRQTSRE